MKDSDYKETITEYPHYDPFTGVKDGVVWTLFVNGKMERQWVEKFQPVIYEDITDTMGNWRGRFCYDPRKEI